MLGTVAGLPASPVNIYNANGTLTSNRTLTQANRTLTFTNTQKTVFFNDAGTGIQQDSGSGTRSSIGLSNGGAYQLWIWTDTNAGAQILAQGNSASLDVGSSYTANPAPIKFLTSTGSSTVGQEKMRITPTGNVGINTTSPTEKLDNNGITRLRNLPANGTANAINTTPGGAASASQDQTFTATRTVVADANGVLGYVAGTPSDAGTSKIIVSAGVQGTQNVQNSTSPYVVGQFTVESLDVYNAWTNNVFTVPANMGGIYILAMQDSNVHTTSADATWHTMAILQKSTDGTTWSNLTRDTRSGLKNTDVDNGNMLYWTGILNSGDQLRVVFNCNSTTSNIVSLGSLTITKLVQ